MREDVQRKRKPEVFKYTGAVEEKNYDIFMNDNVVRKVYVKYSFSCVHDQ